MIFDGLILRVDRFLRLGLMLFHGVLVEVMVNDFAACFKTLLFKYK